jgi:hypothetical protein
MPHFIPHFIANFASLSLVLLDETSVAAAEAVAAGVVETGVAAAGNENAAVVRAAMDNPDKFNFMVFPLNNLPRRNWLVAHMKLHLKNTLCLVKNQ